MNQTLLLSSLFPPSGKFIPLQSYVHFLFVMKKKPEPLMNRLKQKFYCYSLVFYKNLTRLTALLENSKIWLQGFWRRSGLCHFLMCKDSKFSPFLIPISRLTGYVTTLIFHRKTNEKSCEHECLHPLYEQFFWKCTLSLQ